MTFNKLARLLGGAVGLSGVALLAGNPHNDLKLSIYSKFLLKAEENVKPGSATKWNSNWDAREEESIQDLFKQVEEEVAPIDVVIFNPGANVFFPIEETTSRVFRKVWEMAAFGGFLTGREAAKYMKKRNRGSIFFTGATASMRGSSGFSAFSSAKFALRALAQSMARELGPQGIHVAHFVIDGAIDTAFIKETFPDIYALKEKDGILQPEAIADAYWFVHTQHRSAWTHELDLRPYMEKF